MPQIILEHINKRFDKFVAVDDLNLVIEDRGFVTLLVPYPRYLLTTMLFSFNETGYAQYGSAVTLLIIVIIIAINSLVNKLTGASFDKGIGG